MRHSRAIFAAALVCVALACAALAACATRPEPAEEALPAAQSAVAPAAAPASRTVEPGLDLEGAELQSVAAEGGAVVLVPGAARGSYVSPEFAMAGFDWLVPSWAAEVPEGSSVEIRAKVKVKDAWSEWFSFGRWGAGNASEKKAADAFGRVDVDTLVLSAPASALRFRLDLGAGPSGVSPRVRAMGWVARDRFYSAPREAFDWPELDIELPFRSQMVEDPSIAGRICSPTSLSMVLARLGTDLPTAEVAKLVYDSGADMYGNWSFNVAAANGFGYRARVDYFTGLGGIVAELKKGNPVIASIKFGKGELIGAPIDSTSGHLVVVRGVARRGGDYVVIVNDPAAPGPDTVRREYSVKQFLNAWTGVVYVVERP